MRSAAGGATVATVAAAATAGAVVVVPLRTNALELGLSSTEQQHHGRVMSLCARARYLTGRLLASDYYQKRGGGSFLVADGTLTAFAGAISVKNSGSFQTPVTYVKHNGAWVTATTAYYYQSNVWKRIL